MKLSYASPHTYIASSPYLVVANDLKSCWHLANATKILAQESSTDMDPLAVEVRIISTQGEFCDS